MKIQNYPRRLGILLVAGAATACSENPPGLVDAEPRPLTAAEQAVVVGSNAFAWDLLRAAGEGQGGANVFVSPLSVSMALGMTSNGGRGATAAQIHAALGYEGLSQADVNAAFRGLKDLLPSVDRTVDLRVANSVWYRQGFPVEAPFLSALQQSFDAQAEALDFASPTAVQRVNSWVSTETNGRIPDILEAIRPDHVMFLVNAVYFKGEWTYRFDRSRTENLPFRRASGSEVRVPMMSAQDMPVRFTTTEDFSAADLAYGNESYAMTVVVPHEHRTLDDVLPGLDAAGWAQLLASMQPSRVRVLLPRFRVEWTDDLRRALQAMGIADAFAAGRADFSGISEPYGRDLYVSEVLHKTFVEVNEEGTEAAAATSVGISLVSLPPGVYATRPFLVAIRERSSGAILFVGRIEDPSQR